MTFAAARTANGEDPMLCSFFAAPPRRRENFPYLNPAARALRGVAQIQARILSRRRTRSRNSLCHNPFRLISPQIWLPRISQFWRAALGSSAHPDL
jgi:hypothetical protein